MKFLINNSKLIIYAKTLHVYILKYMRGLTDGYFSTALFMKHL